MVCAKIVKVASGEWRVANGEFEVTGTAGYAKSKAAKGIVRMENDLFELTLEETQSLRSQFVTLNDSKSNGELFWGGPSRLIPHTTNGITTFFIVTASSYCSIVIKENTHPSSEGNTLC